MELNRGIGLVSAEPQFKFYSVAKHSLSPTNTALHFINEGSFYSPRR